MSPIGKIFAVLNVLLAALFIGFAANNVAAHKSWKDQHDQLRDETKAELEQKDIEISDLQNTRRDLEARVGEQRSDLEATQQELDRVKADLARERKLAADNAGRLDEIKATLGSYAEANQNLQAAKDQSDSAREAAKEAQRAAEGAQIAAEKAAADAREQLSEARNDIAELERQREALREDKLALATQLETVVQATGVSVTDLQPQPLIQGKVLKVDYSFEEGIVVINQGSEAGVKRGFTFEIHSGRTYKGTVRVESVRENMCTAVITRSREGTTMRSGDNADTRI